MVFQSAAAAALRLLSAIFCLVFLALALALAASYLSGGAGPARILAAFILAGCEPFAPLMLLLGAAMLAASPAPPRRSSRRADAHIPRARPTSALRAVKAQC